MNKLLILFLSIFLVGYSHTVELSETGISDPEDFFLEEYDPDAGIDDSLFIEEIPKVTEADVQQYAKENKVKCYPSGLAGCTAIYCGSGYYDEWGWNESEPCNYCHQSWQCSDGQLFEVHWGRER